MALFTPRDVTYSTPGVCLRHVMPLCRLPWYFPCRRLRQPPLGASRRLPNTTIRAGCYRRYASMSPMIRAALMMLIHDICLPPPRQRTERECRSHAMARWARVWRQRVTRRVARALQALRCAACDASGARYVDARVMRVAARQDSVTSDMRARWGDERFTNIIAATTLRCRARCHLLLILPPVLLYFSRLLRFLILIFSWPSFIARLSPHWCHVDAD